MVSTATVFIRTNRRQKKRGNSPPPETRINARKNKGISSPMTFQSAELIMGQHRRRKSKHYLAMVTGIPMIGQITATKIPKTSINMMLAMTP
jgi:hypothetical protein